MVGEHFPSGWNDRQVSIDFIGGPSSLTGKVVDSIATGCVIELVPEGKPRESRAWRIFPVDRHTIHRAVGGAARAA